MGDYNKDLFGTKKMKRKNKTKIHISAGGIVYRRKNSKIEILLLYRKATRSWHLPKGTKKTGENRKETAIREVKEETGVLAKIEKYLGCLSSIYYLPSGEKINKKTYYYLMKPLIINIQDHDHEHDKVQWVEINRAKNLLAKSRIFEKEDKIINQVIKLLK